MKQIRNNIRRLIPLLTALFLLIAVYGGVSLALSGRRWFSYSSNAYLRSQKKTVTEGSSYPSTGSVPSWPSPTASAPSGMRT